MLEVTADIETLLRQASMTATEYMARGVRAIDDRLGAGQATKHPELLAAFMRTAAQDFHTALMKAAAQDIRDAIVNCAVHLKYLGVGDAATTMGGIEFLGTHLGETIEALANAISSPTPEPTDSN